MSERQPDLRLDYAALMEQALNNPGEVGGQYRRFYNYSTLNVLFLLMQGCPPGPIATFNRWRTMDRYVKRGSKALAIVRPIMIKRTDEVTGEDKQFTRFKEVRCIFPYTATDGEPLPDYVPPEWSPQRAMSALAIQQVAFELMNGNVAGYSFDRNVAVNPVAVEPLPTLAHEIAHVELGHTTPERLGEYATHRGLMEFGAEGTAYLVLSDIGVPPDHWNQAESRGYIQHWLRGEKPSDDAIRQVFKATDRILTAGRPEISTEAQVA